jgi:hypothetical protein
VARGVENLNISNNRVPMLGRSPSSPEKVRLNHAPQSLAASQRQVVGIVGVKAAANTCLPARNDP